MSEEPEFKSLNYLRNGIKYLLEVMAALSILLLTIGLVSASWNFLDKDGLFGRAPALQSLWGLDQALAIDANLPLVFVYLWSAVTHRDWIKAVIYTVIGVMLLFVAATILDMESLRQALNISLDAAATQVHVSMGVITQVRSFATIGLVAMSGLTWTMMLVKHKSTSEPEPEPEPETSPETHAEVVPEPTTRTPSEDMYTKYLDLLTANPTASRNWLAKELGVSPSTISNYRRKDRRSKDNKTHDEVYPVPFPEPEPEEARA